MRPARLDAATIKAAIPPAAFYANEFPGWTPKRRDTWNAGPVCPFHADKHPGSFRVNTATGAYTCFSCGCHGPDVLAFAMARYSLTFREALEHLARTWGIAA